MDGKTECPSFLLAYRPAQFKDKLMDFANADRAFDLLGLGAFDLQLRNAVMILATFARNWGGHSWPPIVRTKSMQHDAPPKPSSSRGPRL